MADSTEASETSADNPNLQPSQQDPSSLALAVQSSSSPTAPSVPPNLNPSPNPIPTTNTNTQVPQVVSQQPLPVQAYAPPNQISSMPPAAPSFRPAALPIPVPSITPQFTPLPNPVNYQNLVVQPPGVTSGPQGMMPPVASGAGLIPVSSLPPVLQPYAPPNPAMRPYASLPNGYPAMPAPAPQGAIPPPGIPRYPAYAAMVRPVFPPRLPGAVPIIPTLSRPPMPVIRGPIIPPVVRPAVIPSVTPTEKPHTTVYVGKIASTVENDFIHNVLQLCGPVKSWKYAQVPTQGTSKGFGFCEFESAEGVLCALRLLSKLNIDGHELMLNVHQATREYLERYVEKKIENSKNLKSTESDAADKDGGTASGADKNEIMKPSEESSKEDDSETTNEEKNDNANFGLVTDEDREADREALDKLTNMIAERLKTRPLPPPPPPPPTITEGSGNSNSELPAKSKDGDSDVEMVKNETAEDKNDDEMTSESKPPSEPDRPETSSPDRNRRNDRRSKDRERDLKREKERELERYEREREQERLKRERDREYKNREDERRYKARVKDWESREREKEHIRKMEREREKEREQERKWEIIDQERENDDSYSKKRKYKGSGEERKRRLREKEEDVADRLKEEEENAEARRRNEEEQMLQKQKEKDALRLLSGHATAGSDKILLPTEVNTESKEKSADQTSDVDSAHGNHTGDAIHLNGLGDDTVMGSVDAPDVMQGSNAPAKKLGFGLIGSGRRTTVPSVFHEEDEDAQKEKKMRPLVPIDYSTEELQAVQPTLSGVPSPNLVAAAEFAKRISNVNTKEEKPDAERERSRRAHDRSSRDRDRHDEENNRTRDESRKETHDRYRDHGVDKFKTPDNQKLLDAKQLIDMIPKTKDELFSYEISWAIYDKNQLHEKMRPWISKKITEFLGEEETSLVDYIVSSTMEHVKASEMLERLQAILDDEAEMFVLKMWRMLIFEIKRVETGLALRAKT